MQVGSPVAASQIWTVPELLADARRVPSGLQATEFTGSAPALNLKVRVSAPVTGSQIFTAPTPSAEARRVPSKFQATEPTGPMCPLKMRDSLPVVASQILTVLS